MVPEELVAALGDEQLAQIAISRAAEDWGPISFLLSSQRSVAARHQQREAERQFAEQVQKSVRDQTRSSQLATFYMMGKDWREAAEGSGYDFFAVKRAQLQTLAPLEAAGSAAVAAVKPVVIRGIGILQIAGGVAEGAAAVATAGVPPVAIAFGVSAADDLYTGVRVVITGELQQSLKSRFVATLAEAGGASPEDAVLAGDLADLAFSIIVGVSGILAARRVLSTSVSRTAGTAARDGAAVPRTAVTKADEFIGPTIGRSGYRTAAEFDAAVGAKYQELVDQGYADTMDLVARRLVKNDPTVIGTEVDTYARTGMRDWLRNVEGIEEAPGRLIQVNRRLYDPAGSGLYRIPDVYIPGAQSIYDATIAEKSIFLQQTIDFRAFSGGANVTIVRPSTLITPRAQGSYGLYFK